jgi:hypothetical protein
MTLVVSFVSVSPVVLQRMWPELSVYNVPWQDLKPDKVMFLTVRLPLMFRSPEEIFSLVVDAEPSANQVKSALVLFLILPLIKAA